MTRSIVDEVIEPFTRTSIDLCYTDIVSPIIHTLPWQARWRLLKWSKLISWKKYDEIRERAKRIYEIMERSGALCPDVTFYDIGGLCLEWENEGKRVMILIAPKVALQYGLQRHSAEIMINNFVDEDEKFYELLPTFADFLYPPDRCRSVQ